MPAKNNCKIFEYELEAQFRCNGSDAFVNWVNNTLGIKRTANVIWDQHEEFDLKVFDSPEDLENAIRDKVKCRLHRKSFSRFLLALVQSKIRWNTRRRRNHRRLPQTLECQTRRQNNSRGNPKIKPMGIRPQRNKPSRLRIHLPKDSNSTTQE